MPYAQGDAEGKREVAAFLQLFKELGWIEGRTVQIDYRFGTGDASRMSVVAKELVRVKPDLILARSTAAVSAVLQETRTIPIVFLVVSDPVGEGFVASLARPQGNVTGFTNVESSLGGK